MHAKTCALTTVCTCCPNLSYMLLAGQTVICLCSLPTTSRYLKMLSLKGCALAGLLLLCMALQAQAQATAPTRATAAAQPATPPNTAANAAGNTATLTLQFDNR